MKKITAILLGLLMVGANAFADGDLIVNGKIGIGVDPATVSPTKMVINPTGGLNGLTINSTDGYRGMEVGLSQSNGAAPSYGIDFSLDRTGSNDLTNDVVAFAANVTLGDTGDRTISGWVYSVSNNLRFNSLTAGTSSVTSPVFTNARFSLVRHSNNVRTYSVDATATNVIAGGHIDAGTGGAVNYSDLRNVLVQNSTFTESSATNLSGIWVEAITAGTNNYGIVLDGDGAGADIVFGPNQESRIYSNGGRLYANDSAGNQTIISPHDPETGEWVFYSKNVKTGKVVRVNMEKLVKAVEKLTGETFMVESLIEE